jgi:HK97 family phage prohead protease
MNGLYLRSYPLDDIRIRAKGDGRTVEAYAAVFDTPTEVKDVDGHYLEVITQRAFDKSLNERGNRFGVFYNHARTLQGTPSELGSIPLGSPVEVRADARGLFTVTRYNKTPLADQVLEAIRNGDISGQSFTGRFLQSHPGRPPYRARSGRLTMVTRKEIALVEYGPTPIPVYEGAAIVGMRALLDRFDTIESLLASRGEEIEEDEPTTPGDEEPEADEDTPDEDAATGAVTEEPPDEGHSARRAAAIGWSRTRADIRARVRGPHRGQAQEEERAAR